MELRMYYQKIRDEEAKIPTPYTVVISRETGDGGKAGVPIEVPRRVAARMVVEGSAVVATAEAARSFQELQEQLHRAAQEAAAAARVEVAVVSSDQFRKLRSGSGSAKE